MHSAWLELLLGLDLLVLTSVQLLELGLRLRLCLRLCFLGLLVCRLLLRGGREAGLPLLR